MLFSDGVDSHHDLINERIEKGLENIGEYGLQFVQSLLSQNQTVEGLTEVLD